MLVEMKLFDQIYIHRNFSWEIGIWIYCCGLVFIMMGVLGFGFWIVVVGCRYSDFLSV